MLKAAIIIYFPNHDKKTNTFFEGYCIKISLYIATKIFEFWYIAFKYFRDVVANLRYQNDSDSSGIEGGVPDVEEGSESDCSGVTEGPEEYASQSDDSIMDDESFLTNQQLQRLHKLPKSLNLVRCFVALFLWSAHYRFFTGARGN